MLQIPTKRFSEGTMIGGILLTIITFFWLFFSISSSLSYSNNDDPSQVGIALISLLFSIALISIGNKKVVDSDYLIIFLKDFIQKNE